MKKKLRTLFWGRTHEHAFGKLETLARLKDDYEIVAAVDDLAVASRWYADHPASFDGLPVISAEEALARDDFDVAFVETTNADLMGIAAKLVAKGIPMHCDKPCGEAMEPYRTLVEQCRAKQLPFQIGYMYRGNPALKWIWQYLAEGKLGEIGFIEADMNHDYGYPAADYAAYLATFADGIFYNLGCHLVDMVMPMVKDELVAASKQIGDAPGYPANSKTRGTVMMRFAAENGTHPCEVLLRTSAGMPGGILCRRLRVDGSLGTIDLCPIERFDGQPTKLILSMKGETPREIAFGVQTDRYADQLLDLAAIVRGEKTNDQDYDRDLRVHETLLKALQH